MKAALQEDVDVVGLSILSGAHMKICSKVLKLMEDSGIGDKPVFVGGIIPPEDAEELKKAGIFEVFGPGTSLKSIAEKIEKTVKK